MQCTQMNAPALTMSLTLALRTDEVMFTAVLTQINSVAKLIALSRANVHSSLDTNNRVCKASLQTSVTGTVQ